MNSIKSKRIEVTAFFVFLFSFLTIAFCHNSVFAADGELKVHYISVGQADSILIDLPNNEVMLIDGGTYGKGETVVEYLKQQGVTKIDYLVNTHPHGDHVGGLIHVVESDEFIIGNIYMTKAFEAVPRFIEFTELLDSRRIEPVETMAGDVLVDETVGDKNLKIRCIAPYVLESENYNNNSIVLKLEYGKISYLFMADAETEEEQQILKKGEDLKCDVYKVGHHGSKTSTTPEFLSKVKPKAAVITADVSENSAGLPSEPVLARLQKSGAGIYRTDLLGTIVSTSDGESFSMNKEPRSEICISSGIITLPNDKYTYTGSAITPKAVIKIGEVELSDGVDYTCKYSENVNIGTATVTLIGKGHYYGSRTAKFKIKRKSISKATYFNAKDMVYKGVKLYPTVTVKDGNRKLANNKDYTITYTKTTSIGEGIVTVKGKGNYSGSKKIYFKIKPKKTKIISKKSLTNGRIMLQWKKISYADGYQILYSVNNKDNFKTLKNVKSGDTVSIIKKLPNMKKYYFYIRAYKVVNGKKVYSDESVTVSLKHKKSIKKCKVSKIKTLKYNGKLQEQKSVVVKSGSKKLKEGTDYTLSYKNNKNRGTATIVIKGKGFYNSSIKKKFTIA